MYLIELHDIHKSFDSQNILNGINLNIEENKTLAIIGKSGCGKSVLIKHIIGLIKPDKGKIIVQGQDINSISKRKLMKVRRKFAMVFQNAALFDSLNVYENVSFGLRRINKIIPENKIKEKVKKILDILDIPDIENKMPSELSGGMRKRVGIARALAMEPEILLYDEPTTGLDPIMSRSIDALILKTTEILNVTNIVVTHDMTSVFNMAHRVIMVHEGKIIEGGRTEELKYNIENPILKEFFTSSMCDINTTYKST